MKKVYICSPLGGDVERNIDRAKKYTEYALKCGVAPVTTHFFALCLDDNNPDERLIGTTAGLELLKGCDELWIFGSELTSGMQAEFMLAGEYGIPARHISRREVERKLGGDSDESEDEENNQCVGDNPDCSDDGSPGFCVGHG